MELRAVQNIVKLTLILAVISYMWIGYREGYSSSLGVFAGSLWGCLNLWLIAKLVQNLLAPGDKDYLKVLGYLGIKFPILYVGGYLLLSADFLSSTDVIVGFSLLFAAILLYCVWKIVPKNIALSIIAIGLTSTQLQASLLVDVPEVPNAITLLYKQFHDVPWIKFLHSFDSLFFSLLVSVGLSLLFYFGSRKKNLVPSGLQNFLELLVENLRKFIVEILGPDGEKYVPFLGTLFIYILTMNWLVLIPFMKAPSSNFNITVALALCVFVLVQYLNIKNYGVLGFLYHLAGSPKSALGWFMVPLMLPIEILTQFTRPLTLSLRLFGNVLGEDILIGAFALFGVAMLAGWGYPIGIPLQIPFMFLALLTSLMQALVFTLLSTIYILLSVPEHEKLAHD